MAIFTLLDYSHKKKYSQEIWTVKLRLLLISENMLKNIAATRSDCTTKDENMVVSYKTDYIVPDLIDFFGDDRKAVTKQIQKRDIHICKKHYIN